MLNNVHLTSLKFKVIILQKSTVQTYFIYTWFLCSIWQKMYTKLMKRMLISGSYIPADNNSRTIIDHFYIFVPRVVGCQEKVDF